MDRGGNRLMSQRCLFLVVSCMFAGLTAAHEPATTNATPLSEEVVRARADALIAQMTPQEKSYQLGQYFYFQISPTMNTSVDAAVRAGEVGSLLFVSDPVQ